jgi:ATP-binding protein involved in chromosome partitioning
MTTIELVRERLAEVRPAGLGRDIVSAGLVGQVSIDGDRVVVQMSAGPLPPPVMRATVEDIRRGVGALAGVGSVEVQVAQPGGAAAAQAPLPGVSDIIAVSSTKGGVGKSTVAVNLACALAQMGLSIGLLDADVYGPSLPVMLGLAGKPEVTEDKKVLPLRKYGLKAMSVGFFLEEGAPVIWRGPMVTGLLRQFLKDVDWGELDLLVIDMPPGTGDAQLTLVQQVPLAGAVVVTTPQDVSLLDVERGIAMFHQVNTPVLGIVENMSYFDCPSCGERDDLFGSGGGERLAAEFGIPLLARIPVLSEVRAAGDAGVPLVVESPDHPVSRSYADVARRVIEAVAAERGAAAGPRIVG